jgi:hypothetical protein
MDRTFSLFSTARMKKKTSILLFRLWLYPPAIVIGSYFATGLAMTAFGAEDKLLQAFNFIEDHYAPQTQVILSAYMVMFFALLACNVPFWATILYFKSGFCMLAPESFNADLVRSNPFLFWDEIVALHLGPKFDKT